MTYELAKQLKEAGFPVRKVCLCESEVCVHITYPTLSELIEACGEQFDALLLQKGEDKKHVHDGRPWVAMQDRFDGSLDDLACGSTPEEAVARLWISLNK